jgi:hypothetical protein
MDDIATVPLYRLALSVRRPHFCGIAQRIVAMGASCNQVLFE